MRAIQINLGEGKVEIGCFVDKDGKRGITLRDTGVEHEIGAIASEPVDNHVPQDGEIYIRCANINSALVLLGAVESVVRALHEDIERDGE